jgi:HK97 family phage portal protein
MSLRSALFSFFRPKAAPPVLTGGQWTGTSYVDSYQRNRGPTANELLAELKNTAFTCASINAAVCASYPPRLYVATMAGQPQARCLTGNLSRKAEARLRNHAALPSHVTKAAKIQEVFGHPLLTLLRQVNPVHNRFDLWELTTLYQEVHGSAYWYLDMGPLGVPEQIWILPAQNVTPRRHPGSPNLVDYYEYRTAAREQRFAPDTIIHFRYPDPRDPYRAGLSPLRACWEQAAITSDYTAFKKAKLDNRAIPDAVICPDDTIGEQERDRLEAEWNSKFRRGGAGKVVIAENGLKVQLLRQSLGDLAALADMKVTKEDIANAFHVPLSFLTSETNLANLQAAEHQHMAKAIAPRLQRRDEKLNEQLLPLFDPTGRLFVASEDPVPLNADQTLQQMQADLKFGVVTINEIRQERGLDPVPWGNTPWLPLQWAPSNYDRRADLAPHTGRNRPEERNEERGPRDEGSEDSNQAPGARDPQVPP